MRTPSRPGSNRYYYNRVIRSRIITVRDIQMQLISELPWYGLASLGSLANVRRSLSATALRVGIPAEISRPALTQLGGCKWNFSTPEFKFSILCF